MRHPRRSTICRVTAPARLDGMPAYDCRTCGVQHASSAQPPPHCPICEDERQYVPPQGQRWATLEELRAEGRRTDVRDLAPGITGIGAVAPIRLRHRGRPGHTAR